jgi:hypothetical protein
MLTKGDVHIEALPIVGGSRYILNQVDQVLRDEYSLSTISRIMGNLIEHILTEFVSPSGPDSILSLYLLGGSVDPVVTNRLSELADLCIKLQDLHAMERRMSQQHMIKIIFSRISNMRISFLSNAFRAIKIVKRDKPHTVQCPPLPFTPVTGNVKVPQSLIGKVKAPSLPPTALSPGKVKGPTLPPTVMSPGKVKAPSLPPTALSPGKAKAPTLPLTALSPGKGKAPSLPPTALSPGKGKAPTLPPTVMSPGKGKAPSLPPSALSPGKVKAPTLPPTALSPGKGKAPSLPPTAVSPGKGKAPSLPPTGKAPAFAPAPGRGKATPPLPFGVKPPAVQISREVEVSIFEAPLIDTGMVESRKVHWPSIPVSRFRDSVFDIELFKNIGEYKSVSFDFEKVKSHFVKPPMSPTCSPARAAPTAASSPVATAVVIPSVLETKRIQQIEIFLNGRKGLTSNDIIGYLKKGGDSDCIDLLEALLPIYPTEEEKQLLQQSRSSMMAKADLFLVDLMKIPEFKIAVNYIIILHTAETVATETLDYLTKLEEFIDAVLESKSVPILLKIVGQIVVYLWNGKKSNFNGYSIEVIPQLKKISSFADKNYSMMNCVVDSLGSDTVAVVLKTLAPVESLLEHDFGDVLLRSEELQRSVRSVKPEERLNPELYSELVSRLIQFKDRMESEYFPRLSEKLETARKKSNLMLKYFAESEKKNFNELLANLNTLRVDLSSAQVQNNKRLTTKQRSVR